MRLILIVGFGRMGLVHFSILNRIKWKGDRIEVVERSFLIRLALKFLGIRTHSSIEAFLKRTRGEVGSVYGVVSTPIATHSDVVRRLLRLERISAIFIEKPMRIDNGLVEFSDKSGVYLQAGYVYRFRPIITQLKGFVSTSRAVHSYTIDYWANQLRHGSRQSSISLLEDMGCHALDAALFLFGEISLLSVEERHEEQGVLTAVRMSIRHASGIEGEVLVDKDRHTARKADMKVICLDADGNLLVDSSDTKSHTSPDQQFAISPQSYSVPFYLRGEEFTLQMDEFIRRSGEISDHHQAHSIDGLLTVVDQSKCT